MVGNEGQDVLSQIAQSFEMIGLQKLVLQDAEPDLNLIQPGSIDGQLVDLDVQRPSVAFNLFLQPTFELLRGVSRAVIQDQGQGMDATVQGFGNHRSQKESLKVHEALAQTALAIDLPIGHAQRAKEMQSPLTPVAVGDVHRMFGHRRVGRPRPLRAWMEVVIGHIL